MAKRRKYQDGGKPVMPPGMTPTNTPLPPHLVEQLQQTGPHSGIVPEGGVPITPTPPIEGGIPNELQPPPGVTPIDPRVLAPNAGKAAGMIRPAGRMGRGGILKTGGTTGRKLL